MRAAGWVLLLTALAGYYVVLVLDLGPQAARLPLRAVGAGGLLASLAVVPATARWPGPVSSSS